MPSKKEILQRLGDLKSMVKELERDINEKYSPQVSPQEMKRSVGEINSEDKEPSSNNEGGSDDICECGKIKEEHWDNIYCDDPLNWVTAFKLKKQNGGKMKEETTGYFYQEEDKSLSDKIWSNEDDDILQKDDVKKAVKELKEEIEHNYYDPLELIKVVDKIFGERLI